MNGRLATIETYRKNGPEMAKYFATIISRKGDVERAFSFVGKKSPLVVEIGCGGGRDAKEIIARTNQYFGMDVSESMIEVAKGNNPTGQFEVGDLASFKFPQNTDIIFSFASLLHSDNKEVAQILDSGFKALSKGGVFYISLKQGHYHKFLKKDRWGTRVFYFYQPEDIIKLAPKKFKSIYVDTQVIGETDWFTIVLQK
jgi:SAM-dependent methyltransferase